MHVSHTYICNSSEVIIRREKSLLLRVKSLLALTMWAYKWQVGAHVPFMKLPGNAGTLIWIKSFTVDLEDVVVTSAGKLRQRYIIHCCKTL